MTTARTRAGACRGPGQFPPDTPTFLFADGIYEDDYVKEGGRWKILGIRVTMTFYAALERARIWFPTAPPSERVPPDALGEAPVEALGRQFNAFRFAHPITDAPLPTPISEPDEAGDRGGGGIAQVVPRE